VHILLLQLESIILIHIVSLFIISAITKVISYKTFLQLVDNFKILPQKMIVIIGSAIPIFELMGATFLLVDRTRIYGALIIILLLMMFSYAINQVLKTNRRISCGCYGRFIVADVDAFTMGKIVYLLVLIIFIGFIRPLETIELSVPIVLVGTFVTIVVLIMQKAWQYYNQTLERLRKSK